MRRRRTALPFLAVAFLLTCQTGSGAIDLTLIPAGALWRYHDGGANLATAWRAAAYDDTAWPSGFAQLGYGDGDESTVLSYGGSTSNRHITYYFRHGFTVTSPPALAAMTARFVRDDGLVAFLNGVEIARSNMPAGTVSYSTLASTAVSGTAESQWFEVPVDPSVLVAGTNVLAVELHQSSASSSDISFDFELRATEAQAAPPSVTLVAPPDGALSNRNAITFLANAEAEAGLASATLHVGGPPRTVTFSGPGQVEDAQITADTPTVPNGGAASIKVDGQSPHAHGLMRFPTLVGSGAGQVPAGAVVNSATLQVNCTNQGNLMSLYRVTESWVEDEATWNQRQSGVNWAVPGADGPASNAGVALAGNCTATGLRAIDITRFVQEWSDGAPNLGLVLVDSGTDGVDFASSESAGSPSLTVVYKDSLVPIATQALSGASATASFDATISQAGTWYWNVQVTDLTGARSWAATDFTFTMDPSLPDEPILVTPTGGATGVSTTAPLEARVGAPGGGQLTVTASLRRAAGPEFTIVALPDTQHYSEAYPGIFTAQTRWIADNKAARNIVFVTHEGDIVEHASLDSEWQAANASMSLLDGVVPYGMGPGNHDQPTTRYNQYFPFTRYAGLPWYGGHYQSLNDNNYQLFSGGGMDFVIVHLEFCPPAGAVSWAAGVLNAYPNRIGMMTTHGYLNESAQRTVSGCASTQYLWDGLALASPNLHFMLSGHVHDESRRTDAANGHPVFQMLADFQDRPSGGEGWLRILRFVPADDRVYVQTYSPWLNRYEADANSEFALDFPMGGAFTAAGTAVAASGGTASIASGGLLPNTEYEWRATVTDASGRSRTGPVWRFTTGSGGTQNGGFDAGLGGWQAYATPDPSYVSAAVVGGVLEFYRLPAAEATQATVFQQTGLAVASGSGLEARFDLGNSSTARKRISVLVLEHDFSDLSVCTFWLAPGAPLRTYRMRTHTTKAWSNAAIYFYAATAGADGGAYRVDNVALLPDPAVAGDRTECIDPTAPPPGAGADGSDLLTNGGFSAGSAAGWTVWGQLVWQVAGGAFEFYRPSASPDPAGVILQPTNTAAAAGEVFTAQFDLGNSSGVRTRVTVLLHDLDFSDLHACTFWVPAGQPLQTYVMRSFTTEAWTNATISIYASSPGDDTWTVLDNVSLRKTPAALLAGVDCLEPGAAASFGQIAGSAPAAEPVAAVPSTPAPGASPARAVPGRARPVATTPAAAGRRGVARPSEVVDFDRLDGTTESRGAVLTRLVDLRDLADPRLQWRSWSPDAKSAASASVLVSVDGRRWQTLAIAPPVEGWILVDVDLSAHAGHVVWIRFVFGERPLELLRKPQRP